MTPERTGLDEVIESRSRASPRSKSRNVSRTKRHSRCPAQVEEANWDLVYTLFVGEGIIERPTLLTSDVKWSQSVPEPVPFLSSTRLHAWHLVACAPKLWWKTSTALAFRQGKVACEVFQTYIVAWPCRLGTKTACFLYSCEPTEMVVRDRVEGVDLGASSTG